jgi:hypothetical protein
VRLFSGSGLGVYRRGLDNYKRRDELFKLNVHFLKNELGLNSCNHLMESLFHK